jgi:hypothetical protein
MPNSDLNTLLLKVFQIQAGNTTPTDVLKAFHESRFSVPSEINPIVYHRLETELLTYARETDIKAVLLSPSAPFSSCSAFDCVDQNNVLSAGKSTELLSDPTNMLAIIMADQLKNGGLDNREPIHFCTTARVTRGQAFAGKMSFPHFGIFCIVSSGRDTGSYVCEKDLLVKQLQYYKKLFEESYGASLSVVLKQRGGYKDGDGFFARMSEIVAEELPDVPLSFDRDHTDNAYYKGINFQIFMRFKGETVNIGDGGFTDWTQKLTGSRKERCLTSGIGLDRLLLMRNAPRQTSGLEKDE